MDFREGKGKTEMLIMIGLSAGDTISYSLRQFYDTIKHYDLNKGEGFINKYKELEGKFFVDEGQFILHNKQTQHNTDLTNISVSNKDLKMFERLCKDYGVDILYLKRPDNLEKLLEMDENKVELTKNQRSVLDAYTIKHADGSRTLKEDASLICFNYKDLDVMERVLDKLEERTLTIEKRKQRATAYLEKIKGESKTKEQTVEKRNIDVDSPLTPEEALDILYENGKGDYKKMNIEERIKKGKEEKNKLTKEKQKERETDVTKNLEKLYEKTKGRIEK